MTTLKTLIVVTALLANGTSLVVAQNDPPTSGQLPVAGGADGACVASNFRFAKLDGGSHRPISLRFSSYSAPSIPPVAPRFTGKSLHTSRI